MAAAPLRQRLQRGLVPPAVTAVQRRFLNLHEYQAQKIFQDFGVSVPKNTPVFSVQEAVEKSGDFAGDEVVVKSQVLAGGRGLGYFKENGAEVAEKMLGKTLITKQTGAEGKPNNTLMLA